MVGIEIINCYLKQLGVDSVIACRLLRPRFQDRRRKGITSGYLKLNNWQNEKFDNHGK